jgi:hypothetical protein
VEPAFSIILIAFLGFEFQTQFIKPWFINLLIYGAEPF